MKRVALSVGLVAGLLLSSPGTLGATPEAATWHRDVLLGETADRFVALRTVRSQPGSYYTYDETVLVLEVAKMSRRVLRADTLIRRTFHQDFKTEVWSSVADTLAPVDLAPRLVAPGFRLAFSTDWQSEFHVDRDGVHVAFPDGRVRVMSREQVLAQLPALGDEAEGDSVRVVGVEITNLDAPESGRGFFYLKVLSGFEAMDTNWTEDLLLVPAAQVREAYERLDEALERKGRR